MPAEEELCGLATDPHRDPPDDWLRNGRGLPPGTSRTGTAGPEVLRAGMLPRESGGGTGFAAGGAADRLAPGVTLAGFAGDVWADGLCRISDDELIGVLRAWRRLSGWTAAGELAAVAELNRRRTAEVAAGADPRLAEHVGDELAVPLTLTSRGADLLLEFACGLARLPRTRAALAAGLIDRSRALVVVDEVAGLDDAHAAAIDSEVLARAPEQTTGQLRAAVRRAVLTADPAAASRRREQARKDARVEVWNERHGTAALAGRDLPPAQVLAADRRINSIAHELKAAGAQGSMDELRASVYTALLLGQPIASPFPPAPDAAAHHGARPEPDHPEPQHSEPQHRESRPGRPVPGSLAPGGSVNLTMPLAALLGASGAPGEVAGFGPVGADDSRALAGLPAIGRGARWCLTLTGRDGRPLAHGCASAGPGRAGDNDRDWALTVTIRPFATGTCDHERQSGAYRPPPSLLHRIRVRQRTCCFPGCRRPAHRCDLDHTLAYDQGGRTCECNLAPLCRRHHRAKQVQGWHLEQPQPGFMIWRLPHGRVYRVGPEPYPAEVPEPPGPG